MKKIIMTIGLFCAVCVSALAQNTITMKFTGRNQNNDWIPLSYVLVENQTQRWQELVYYPDTTLFMGNVGIDDYLQNEKVQLFQNVPNPFDGVTDFALQLDEDQRVLLEIYDVNGKMVAQYEHALPQGQHLFRATLTVPQTYLLSAKTENDRLHIKMVNKGNGGENSIAYLGEGGSIQYQLKSDSKDNAPYYFANGDWMKYVGYANLCGTEFVSTPVEKDQTQSETVNLVFTLPVPTVITNAADNITASSARLNGDANGQGYTLTERGFYYGSSNSSMTEKVVSNGTGDGAYYSFITDLNPGSTYYFKAYAKSLMGTAYGQTLSVQTLATYPTVNTGTISDIMPTSAIGQGNVVSNNGATVTERGLCWSSTTQFPTLTNANHVSAGTGGNGSYSCSMTGLVPTTTYYVRAYATNSEGTAYGNTVSFTTLAPTVATITTTAVSSITSTSATSGGNITADGGASVTARGVCWSTSQNPTVSNSHTTNGSGTGSFTSSMTGLIAGTTYYVRAYATNSVGTVYGNQVSFTTNALATVTTTSVTSITQNSASSGGNITADGGASVTARGVCWSTSQNPTVSNSHTTNGSGTGSFTSSMTGLTAGTTYYVRAYATNSVGTAYGSQVSFTTAQVYPPTVTTNSVSNITENSATCGGNVTSQGSYSVTARGVCWSTSQNPTVSNSHTTNGSGTGSFTSSITGLQMGTTYYVRAYATNSVGTSYGTQRSFTTAQYGVPCPGTPTITDYDNNTYNTVQIGQQCWMKQNLKTTHYSDGTTISLGSTTSETTAYRYYPNNSSSNVSTYGYLYNWKAVMRNSSSSSSNPSGVQGICPTGWHVPSDAEWTQLTTYVSSQSQYVCGSSTSNIAKALAGTTGWSSSTTTCAVGNTPANNNATGFSAVPAGFYDGSYYHFGGVANFWSATQYSSYNAYIRNLSYSYAGVSRTNEYKYYGFAVRCLRDESSVDVPTVTTTSVTSITQNSATSGGNVTATGGASVTARGVCWSTSQNPTVSNSHTTNGSGTGSFTSSMTGLTAGTTYYVRAYATNSAGTAYGNQVSFTTAPVNGQPCPGAATVTDYDGNTYNTVQIGQQCWMKQNLKTTHYSDGTSISLGSNTSTTTAYRYYPNNSSSNVSTYGYLYNWKAVMRNSSSSSSNPSGVQGICPTGWHVPSDAEWTQLTDYVSSQSEYVCGSTNTNIAKALASTTGWSSSSNSCAVGNNPSSNNATGFSAIPAGYYYGSYDYFGYSAYFWSATQSNSSDAYNRYLNYNNAYVGRHYGSKGYGFSVRCLRDESGATTSIPTVTTTAVSSITSISATSGGNVTADGGASVTARGVCWSTSQNPTVSNSHTTNGSGTGSFTSSMTGLTAGTTYYVRAYATNSVGTAYGSQISFTTNASVPTVTTTSVTSITQNSATSGGNVTATGGASVTARGVCWSTSQNPTVSNSHTTNGSGTGSFTSSMTGLTAGTTYYVRAYATNSAGTAYGNQVSFTTNASVPTVTTTSVTSITQNSASSGGNITADGGASVTARGVCWSTSQNPTVSNSHTTNGSGTGSFTSSMTGLTAGTTYYVRAYATNSAGTAYGEQKSFTTAIPFTCGTSTVTDYDGNTYNTVQIGQQCWMKQNLKTTHYSDGTSISLGSSTSTTTAYRYYPNNSSSNVATYGYLYNWKAVMRNSSSSSANPSGVQGICPTGWHVPSDAEWTQLTDYVSSQSQYVCGSNSTYIAKALASATGWNSSTTTCAVGNTPANNNATGFSAVPAGYYGGSYNNFSSSAGFWSATQDGSSSAYRRYLSYGYAYVYRANDSKNNGFSVRCLRDESGVDVPTVTTTSVTSITQNSASSGGNITADGGATVTARGVCWSTSQNPTVSNSHTTNGSGTGSFTSSMTGLTAGTTYYVRAYATNSVGTAYGEQKSFTTAIPFTCGTSTVTDYDGNTYNTVQIGQQCWMKQNLRTTHYSDGTSISLGSSTSTTTAYRYYPNNNSSNVATYGYLYNWKAVMRNSSSSSANPSGVQGICPMGWHVPSDAEWTQLTDYVSSQSQYVCGSNNTYIAKALASTTGWNTNSGTCAVGNTPANNNATGFSAVPAGNYLSNGFVSFGNYARFWSATQISSGNAYGWYLYYKYADVGRSDYDKNYGFSVRCVRD